MSTEQAGRLLGRPALLLFIALASFSPLFADQSPDDLFQQALVKESVDRNLKAAIGLYQQTVGHPRVGPSVAGQARLRMGLCYEKLGKPAEAEMVYRQLLANTSGVSPEILQKAKAHLREVAAENHFGIVQIPGKPSRILWIPRTEQTPISVLFGPAVATGMRASPVIGLEAALRWRLTSEDRPLRFYAEALGMVPVARATVQNQVEPSNRFGITTASLDLRYQTSLGLVAEVSHGRQRRVIPEIGAGLQGTASRIRYSNTSFSGEQNETHWNPYLRTGLQLFSDRALSVLIHATFTPTPYVQSVDVPGQSTTQSFAFPSSSWIFGAMIQWKIGVKRLVPELQK